MKSYLNFNCSFDINENPLNLDIEDFLEIGVRNNKKRRFLFISKVLGKHLACKPTKMDELGKLLVDAYNIKTRANDGINNGTVIAFAETGTGLGHSFFDYIDGDYEFIHTTREKVEGLDKLEFLEEHSHATDQILYYGRLNKFKEKNNEIILVDDEITTAKTCMNIIRKIHSIYPKKKYTICSILNWVEGENLSKIKELKKELNCEIDFVYLFKGDFEFEIDEKSVDRLERLSNSEVALTALSSNKDLDVDSNIEVKYLDLNMDDYIRSNSNRYYLKNTGRFGINKEDQKILKETVKRENLKLDIDSIGNKERKTLFLGTEENMYIPMLFALENESKINVYYHSTTRSPIIPIDEEDYPIKTKKEIDSFYNGEIKNFIYNIDRNNFTDCFLFVELNIEKEYFKKFISTLRSAGIKKVTIVSM